MINGTVRLELATPLVGFHLDFPCGYKRGSCFETTMHMFEVCSIQGAFHWYFIKQKGKSSRTLTRLLNCKMLATQLLMIELLGASFYQFVLFVIFLVIARTFVVESISSKWQYINWIDCNYFSNYLRKTLQFYRFFLTFFLIKENIHWRILKKPSWLLTGCQLLLCQLWHWDSSSLTLAAPRKARLAKENLSYHF